MLDIKFIRENAKLVKETVKNKGLNLDDLGIDRKLADEITEVIKLRIKPPEVEIKGKFNISVKTGDGINTIKEALKIATTINDKFIIQGSLTSLISPTSVSVPSI